MQIQWGRHQGGISALPIGRICVTHKFIESVGHPSGSAHRRSLTSNPCFFSSGPFNLHSSSHPSTLTLVSADRPIDLRSSSAELMAPGWFRIGGGHACQQTRRLRRRVGHGRIPRGEGIERETAAVCRHLAKDGTRVVNLVTDESMIGGEKFAAKSEFGFLLILTKQTSYALAKNRIPAPCAFGNSSLSKITWVSPWHCPGTRPSTEQCRRFPTQKTPTGVLVYNRGPPAARRGASATPPVFWPFTAICPSWALIDDGRSQRFRSPMDSEFADQPHRVFHPPYASAGSRRILLMVPHRISLFLQPT